MYLYVYKGDAYINRSIRIYKLRAITFGIKTIAKKKRRKLNDTIQFFIYCYRNQGILR